MNDKQQLLETLSSWHTVEGHQLSKSAMNAHMDEMITWQTPDGKTVQMSLGFMINTMRNAKQIAGKMWLHE